MSSLWDKAQEYFYSQEDTMDKTTMQVITDVTEYKTITNENLIYNKFIIHHDSMVIQMLDNKNKSVLTTEMSKDDAIKLAYSILKYYVS
jgi:hypothetical protein